MSKHHRFRTKAIAIVAASLAVLASCGRSDTNNNSSNSSSPSGSAASQVKPGPGFDGTTLTLGVVTPVTGRANILGDPITAGNKVFFDAVNAKGGIGGKYKVNLKVVDSAYQTQQAVQAYNGVKAEVAMVVQLLGTAIVDAIKPSLSSDGLLAGPASLDAFWVHEPNLMPIGGPYQIQMINGLDYAVRKLDAKSKKLCVLRADDPYGEAGLAGVTYGAEKMGLTITSQATFKTGDTDFTAQISQLQGAGCEIVTLTAIPSDTPGILGEAIKRNFAPKWLGQSPTWLSAFAGLASLEPYMAANYILTSEGVNWGDTSVPGMQQMLTDVQKFKPDQKPDIYFVFGYGQAWAADQILEEAAKAGDLSPQGILDASHKIAKLTFGDLFGDYTYGAPGDRNPPRRSSMFAVYKAAPGGLNAIETNFTSDAAKSYEFNME